MCVEVPRLIENDEWGGEVPHHAPVYWLDFEKTGTPRNVVASLPALLRASHHYLSEERDTDYGSELHSPRVKVDRLYVTHCSPSFRDPGEFVETLCPRHLIVSAEELSSPATAPSSADMFNSVRFGQSNHFLHSIDISSIAPYIRSIRVLLSCCSELKAAPDLSTLQHLVKIEYGFLCYCPALSGTIDFSSMTALTSIGDNFVNGTSLSSIILPPSLSSIGEGFLMDSPNLTKIDLSPLKRLTVIPVEFMSCCTSITEVDLSPLAEVTTIGSGFLYDCAGITALDTSVLKHLRSLGGNFAGGTGVTSINLEGFKQTATSHVTDLGPGFLLGCAALVSVDLSPLSQIKFIGSRFMGHCTSLTAADMSMMTHVRRIEEGFFGQCTNLATLDMTTLPMNKESTRFSFEGCTNLKTVVAPEAKCHGPALGRLTRGCKSVGAKIILK